VAEACWLARRISVTQGLFSSTDAKASSVDLTSASEPAEGINRPSATFTTASRAQKFWLVSTYTAKPWSCTIQPSCCSAPMQCTKIGVVPVEDARRVGHLGVGPQLREERALDEVLVPWRRHAGGKAHQVRADHCRLRIGGFQRGIGGHGAALYRREWRQRCRAHNVA